MILFILLGVCVSIVLDVRDVDLKVGASVKGRSLKQGLSSK